MTLPPVIHVRPPCTEVTFSGHSDLRLKHVKIHVCSSISDSIFMWNEVVKVLHRNTELEPTSIISCCVWSL